MDGQRYQHGSTADGHSAPEATTSAKADDPYIQRPEHIIEPPAGWVKSIRYMGPGLITSAAIVGSGELIATTALGAEVGFVLLWLVIFSTLVKVAIQIELARYAISTGEPGLSGLNRVPPRFGRSGWINILWLLMNIAKLIQNGGIVGGVAVAMSILLPFGEPLGRTSIGVWCAIVVVACIALLITNSYTLVERLATALVAVFTMITIAIALGLPFTPFAYDAGDILHGLALGLPPAAVAAAVAMFGITGVGADEVVQYTYWALEKGYGKWAGPNDGTEEWKRRANGWIAVMTKDAIVSWFVYTFSTAAFYIMGAAVLHPQGLVPEGNELITTLSRMYTDTLGDWANVVFLLGAVAVLGSTLLVAIPSVARTLTNIATNAGLFAWTDTPKRMLVQRVLIVALPISWATFYLFMDNPVLMVQIGGVAVGVALLGLVIGVWYLRVKHTDPAVRGGRFFKIALAVSSAAIGLLGIYTIGQLFGLISV